MSKKEIQVKVRKSVLVDIDKYVSITHDEIIEALKKDQDFDFDDFLESMGFIKASKLSFTGTIVDQLKLELIKELMENTSLDNLEKFRMSL